MEYKDAKIKANVIMDSLIKNFSNDKGDIEIDEQVLRSTFEHIFDGAYESGKRDGIKFTTNELKK